VTVEGHVAQGYEPVADLFEQELATRPGTGAAFALWHDGGFLVDLWGGHADAAGTRRWGEDTLVMPYSVTKPFAAVCVVLLADRGLLDLDAPMTQYWPALPTTATVRQVLAHSAGHVLLEEPAPREALLDWDLMCRLVERQRPLWTPGEALGESALLYGHLLGQVVRAVDGRSLGTFLRDEVCLPHDLDFHVGVPADALPRVADLTGFDASFLEPRRRSDTLMWPALSNPPGALDPATVNSPAWRQAEVPAVNGHGTARAVASFYAALATGRVLSEDGLREMVSVQADGFDRVVGADRSWGLGVMVEDDGWGMGGFGGSYGWWSESGRYAVGSLTGTIPDADLGDRLENVARAVLGLPPL
jgi:CubicO group peptidase (beta-lactamase class C family)